ncbi:MAG: ABC transporter ATP-binding protein/permease [Lachnospiraceae bacterium]|nr:ABC transporter ATP-binding protein/permease [Lachnospiraceae bacterium]
MIQLFRQAKLSKVKLFFLIVFVTIQILGTLYLPTLTANIINNGVVAGDLDYVKNTGLLMLVVAVITGIFSILSTYLSAEVSTRFALHTRKRLFAHTQALSYQDFRHFNASSLITRATNDVEQLQSTLGMFFDMMLPAPFVVVIGLVLAFTRDATMAFIIMVSAIIFLLVLGIMVKKVFPLFAEVQKGLDKINSVVGQYISGIRVIRAYNRAKLEKERIDDTFLRFAKINIRINRMFASVMPIIMLGMNLAIVAIIWFGGHRISAGEMQIGDITAIIEYSMNILMYLIMAVFALIFIPRAKVCAERVLDVLRYKPEMKDGPNRVLQTDDVCLEFRDVSFSYADAENPVLHNLNFVCKQGTTTAFIGGTGSGKSTVARLISRLLDATSGSIIMNGVDIKDLSQESLRKEIGFVPQKAFLFGGTVADNIQHGKAGAHIEEVKQAASIAQAADFIVAMEEGYDSVVSQAGKNLSGGQRQRLAVARMLLKKPAIYVFDDSFSALDFKTDALLRKALKKETQNAIVINIAQRISTIQDADQIIVLDEGRIVGKGTHTELLKSSRVYQEIAGSQFSEEELDA